MLYLYANKIYNANNCWHFNIYGQDKLNAQHEQSCMPLELASDLYRCEYYLLQDQFDLVLKLN